MECHEHCMRYNPRHLRVLLWLLALSSIHVIRAQGQVAPPAQPRPQGQQSLAVSLADLLAQTPWNAAKRGPLLVVDPAQVRLGRTISPPPADLAGSLPAASLALYKRALFRVGTLAVLAPTEMTCIEESPRKPANLYTGLPRSLKIKYLLATLTPQQWKQLGEKGVGLSDLTAEQQPVYLSLLPDPFVVNRWKYDANGEITEASHNNHEEIITLSPEQRAQIRLHVQRSVSASVPLLDQPHTSTAVNLDPWHGKPNGERLVRGMWAELNSSDVFGVSLSSTVPNKPKPGHLNFESARLNTWVSLEGAATIGDLIGRAGEATHLELHADARVAHLPLLVHGSRARAGDVLKALALAVTGTYRKLGSAFVLTHDLVGIGAQQWRLAEWQAQLEEETERLEKELTRQIQLHSEHNRGIYGLGFAPADPYALTPELSREADAGRFVPAEQLPPQLAQDIRRSVESQISYNATHNRNGFNPSTESASLTVSWTYAFELGDGRLLNAEDRLGMYGEFLPSNTPPARATPSQVDLGGRPLPLPAWAKERIVFLTPLSSEQAVQSVDMARRLGFTALVLRTEAPLILQAAIRATQDARRGNNPPLAICALMAPFSTALQEEALGGSLDRNLLGETIADVSVARGRQERWRTYLEATVTAASPLHPEKLAGVTSALSPLAPALPARWQHIAGIAQMEGLAGLYLRDTQPGGYAEKSPYTLTDFSLNAGVLTERGNLGFTPAMRLGFLRQEGMDPIDLIPRGLHLSVDLPRPFFPDYEASYRLSDAEDELLTKCKAQWSTFRNEANRRALSDLYAAVQRGRPALPLSVEARPEWNNSTQAAGSRTEYAAWTAAGELPIWSENAQGSDQRFPLAASQGKVVPLLLSASPLVRADVALKEEMQRLQQGAVSQSAPTRLAFDLSYLPLSRALALLNEYIVPAP